jgi:hypothetical protein
LICCYLRIATPHPAFAKLVLRQSQFWPIVANEQTNAKRFYCSGT